MRNLIKVIVFLIFISGLVFAQSAFISTTSQPTPNISLPTSDSNQILNRLLLNLPANSSVDRSLLELLIKISQQSALTSSQPTSVLPVSSIFDDNRDNDVLIQVNNLQITKIVPAQDLNAKAYFYVVKDVGWNCTFYKKIGDNISSFCPLNIRRVITQREIVVRANNDTILLLRNRARTNVNQFNVGDKINIYGFFDKDNFTFDALVIRKIVAASKPLPLPTVPSPVFPAPTETSPIGKLQERWFVGYLEDIIPSPPPEVTPRPPLSDAAYNLVTDDNLTYIVKPFDDNVNNLMKAYSNQRVRLYAVVNSEASKTNNGLLIAKQVNLSLNKLQERWFVGYLEKMRQPSTQVESGPLVTSFDYLYYLTTDNNLVYSIEPGDSKVGELLDRYANQRVRLYAAIKREASKSNLGLLIAKEVIPLSNMESPTSTVNSVSGFLSETGASIYMWGTHTLKGDDGKTYQVKALSPRVLEDLRKYTGKRVTIYAKKVYFNNLEGGFWAIEAEKVILLQ